MLVVVPVGGQASPQYQLQRLNGATFVEQVRTDVTSEAGVAEQVRRIGRTARFSIVAHGDTLVVTADSLDLRETTAGVERAVDVDAVIGGRWTLTLDPRGRAVVNQKPFVPDDVIDVSNVAIAMDDFFPPAPPALNAGQALVDRTVRNWHRLADSAGLSRYRWSVTRHSDSNYTAAENVPVQATIDIIDNGDIAWDAGRGPVAWSRRVETTATSHFAGRTSRAVITQRVAVRRTP